MKLVLVPTDFSENASHALEYAVETANAIGAGLLVMSVYSPPVSVQSALQTVVAEDTARVTKIYREKLNTIAETVKTEFPSVSCAVQVTVGDVVSEIVSLAGEKKADLIVMGTQGASKVVNVLFGSNTASVIEKAACPVLCIPQGLSYQTPKRILFATNFAYSDIEGAKQLVGLAKAFGAEVVFGHVVVGAEETEEEKAVVDKFAIEIRLLTGYGKISGKVISDAHVNAGLDALIEQSQVNMIALSTRKRNLFEKIYNPSITKKFSYYTNIPLLAFHAPNDM
ncbi:MAG: universal stress protein [Cyclobacteriaceae bacterium]|nr:universal stress protein [Cyclobacteriaceae bacterium]UYN85434.1 MAG: universal stress protein [Cyclobacteriaceae bacterium]